MNAQADVKNSLGLGSNDNLFSENPSQAVKELTDKVTAAVAAMFAKLAVDFGITISDKTIMLVMNEIIPQLGNIKTKTPNEIANGAFDGKTEQELKDKMDELADNQPKNVLTLLANGVYVLQTDGDGSAAWIILGGLKLVNDKLCGTDSLILQNKDNYPNDKANNFESKLIINNNYCFSLDENYFYSSVNSYIGTIKGLMSAHDRSDLAKTTDYYDYVRTNKTINITGGGIIKFNWKSNGEVANDSRYLFDAKNMRKILEVYFADDSQSIDLNTVTLAEIYEEAEKNDDVFATFLEYFNKRHGSSNPPTSLSQYKTWLDDNFQPNFVGGWDFSEYEIVKIENRDCLLKDFTIKYDGKELLCDDDQEKIFRIWLD